MKKEEFQLTFQNKNFYHCKIQDQRQVALHTI